MKCKKLLLCFIIILLALGLISCQSRAGVPRELSSDKSEPVLEREMPSSQEQSDPDESESAPEQEPDGVSPEDTASGMLTALQTGNPDEIQEYLDYVTFFELDGDGAAADWQYLELLKHLRFDVISCEVTGDEAKALVRIANVDMETVLPLYFKQAMDLEYKNAVSENPMGTVDMDVLYVRLYGDLLDEYDASPAEREVTVTLGKINGEWKIFPDNKLRDAVLGGYFSARAQTGENAG